jgi:hypothetical protein
MDNKKQDSKKGNSGRESGEKGNQGGSSNR